MNEDAELLQRYGASQSGEAFAELVRRHLPFVYAAALRQLDGAVHRAEDVTQIVFVELARQARALSGRAEIVGWLYTTTHHQAAKLKRSEARRQQREQAAHLMHEDSAPASIELEWERLRPVLDEAMHELNDEDRTVILMRFFQTQRFADIGQSLGLTEDAARRRAERALDKLRVCLARREITSTTAALAVVLANQPAVAASATLAATVTQTALASGGLAAGASAGAGTWATLPALAQLPVGLAGLLAVVGTLAFVLQTNSNARLRTEIETLRQTSPVAASLRAENRALARTVAEVAELRHDEAELARLNDEAAALQRRWREVARAEENRAAREAARARLGDRDGLDRAPVAQLQLRPFYPVELRTRGLGGEVWVEFAVDARGAVSGARSIGVALRGEKIVDTVGPGERVMLVPFTVATIPVTGDAVLSGGISDAEQSRLLEEAALAAVRQWRFTAGRKNGRDVNTRMAVPMVFVFDRGVQP